MVVSRVVADCYCSYCVCQLEYMSVNLDLSFIKAIIFDYENYKFIEKNLDT